MIKIGCPIGAALMNRWFSKTAYTMTESVKISRTLASSLSNSAIISDVVKMNWVLNYTRTHNAYLDLKDVISGMNKESLGKSKALLFKLLKENDKIKQIETSFGESHLSTMNIYEKATINFRSVGTKLKDQMMDPTDDLYCALGAFAIHLAASGKVKPVKSGPTSHEIHIEKFGYFIRDTYDFNGYQPLGFWSIDGVSKTPIKGYSIVDNGSFRDWRNRHHMGGDFLVFSDIKWEPLRTPLVWKYPY